MICVPAAACPTVLDDAARAGAGAAVICGGGFAEAQQLPVAAAGKTGTTTAQKAVWFCGYTTHLAAAAVIAGIDNEGRPDSLVGKTIDGTYIYEASGSGFAAPIWGDALRPLTAGQPYDDFVYPQGIEGVGVTSVPQPKPSHGGGHGGHGHGHGHGR